MKVTKEKVENSQAYLTVEMEQTEMEPAVENAYRRMSQKTSIPGFRKGKAPRAILEQYIGRDSILEDAMKQVVPQAYEQALKEQEIEPYAQPEVEIVQADPIIFKAVVPLPPEVTLGDYQDIRIEQEKVEVTKENVDEVLEELRHQNATWEPIDRPLEYNDLATIDVNGKVDGKPYIQRVGMQYQVMKDAASPAPGFVEQIIGMNKGDEREFNLIFPEEYPNKEVAGKESTFKVKLTEIKEEKMPEMNDEFVTRISEELKTVESLREEVDRNLKLRAEERIRMDFQEQVINSAIEQTQIEYPPILIDLEINRILEEQARQLQMSGRGMDDYLRSINKTEEQLREDLRPVAIKNIEASLTLSKLAEAEKIEVTEADINEGIENMASGTDENRREEFRKLIDTPQTRESLKQTLLTRKTIERLTEIAKKPAKTGTKTKEEKEEKE